MNKPLIALVAIAAVVGGLIGGVVAYKLNNAPLAGGDFPGGIVPSNLWSVNTSTGAITPIGSFNVGVGGTAYANQITALYTATTSYPTAAITLGPITANNSATSTSFAFNASGLSVGDSCQVTYNGGPTSGAFGADAFITAVSGNNVTGTATFWNGATASTTLNVTSTATGASSTLKLTCFHTGV